MILVEDVEDILQKSLFTIKRDEALMIRIEVDGYRVKAYRYTRRSPYFRQSWIELSASVRMFDEDGRVTKSKEKSDKVRGKKLCSIPLLPPVFDKVVDMCSMYLTPTSEDALECVMLLSKVIEKTKKRGKSLQRERWMNKNHQGLVEEGEEVLF